MNDPRWTSQFGPWALVTGASSGIGEQFARLLARRGLNLILVARRQRALEALRSELAGVEVEVCVADLSATPLPEELLAKATEREVGLVVSNAGGGTPGRFLDAPVSDLLSGIRLNVAAHLQLAQAFGRPMAMRGRGGLLFVSSTGALQGVPGLVNYSAAKAYTINLAEGLNRELKPQGVHVTTLLPGPTDTPLIRQTDGFDVDRMPMAPMRPEAVAAEGLAALRRNRPTHIAGRLNRVMAAMPRRVSAAMWAMLMRRMMPSLSAPALTARS